MSPLARKDRRALTLELFRRGVGVHVASSGVAAFVGR